MAAPDHDPDGAQPMDAAEIDDLRDAAISAIEAAGDLESLKQARLDHAGDKSPLALANRAIGTLAGELRKDAGMRVGKARGAVNKALQARQADLEVAAETRALAAEVVDVTLPADRLARGARHPLTTIQETVSDIFIAMGWEIAEGPEVEAEWLNFDALNLGPDHPARTMQDTFWVTPERAAMVLRTHTSPVQARTMLTREPPIFVVCPGRVFRTDELDATHTPVFNQIEGLAVAEGITMAHLKGTLDQFVSSMFGVDAVTRFRPSYFPFTEPSAELDVRCFVCKGDPALLAHCRTCRGEGWIEVAGCGVVNPRVLIACGVDPERYSGFAFGIGLDRTLMLRHGIADMRDMVDGDIRFTLPFGVEL